MSAFVSSAPGKVILSGEHSVVHSRLALASVIERRSFARFESRSDDVVELVVVAPAVGNVAESTSRFSWTLDQLRPIWNSHAAICGQTHLLPLEHRTHIDALLDALHSVRIAHGSKTDEQTCSVFLFLVSVFCAQQNAFHGVTVRVSTELPLSSGLGSSAAYSVSLAQGFWHLLKCSFASTFPVMHTPSHADLVLINHWAFECERMMHGNPSGVDNTVSTFGGALAFRRGMDPIVLSQVHSLRLLVVNTKQTRDTKKLVGGVGTRLAKHELVMQPILDAMHHIALSVAQLIAPAHTTEVIKLAYAPNAPGVASNSANQDSYADLVELFSMNQALLNGIGVGHAVLDRVCDVARAAGFPGAKLTGAGGGGCALVLLPSDQHTNSTALIHALEAEGFQAFETTVGGLGAQLRVDDSS